VGLRGADRRAAADGDDQQVGLPEGRGLLLAQRGLPEVAEVGDADAAEREREDRLGAALGPGDVVVTAQCSIVTRAPIGV
jgi:hypothetical protein